VGKQLVAQPAPSREISGEEFASTHTPIRPKEVNMKKQVIQVILAMAVSLSLAVAVGSAQSSPSLKADIPFDFHVGRATLPSGEYTVKSVSPASGAICIQSRDGSKVAMALTIPFAPSKKDGPAKMVFNRYGSDYFLSQVSNPSDSLVRELMKTKAETEIAKKVNEAQTTEVALTKH
jgi:hypothetical protein